MRGSWRLAALAVSTLLATTGSAVAAPAYGSVHDAADLDRIFDAIRADVATAQTRADLTRLYRRAGYLVTLTFSHPWRAKFGDQLPQLRDEARRDFKLAVQDINRRASEIGTGADYRDSWGDH